MMGHGVASASPLPWGRGRIAPAIRVRGPSGPTTNAHESRSTAFSTGPPMAFHDVRFPLDIALGARGGPERMTDIVTLSSGREERNSRWAQSRRRYNAGYGVKSRADMQAVLAFFEERRGRFHSFLWRDGLDQSSNGGDGTPTPFDQSIGVGDGATTAFQLTKTYGASFDPYARPITKPVAGSVRVAVDGTELTTGFS